MRLTPIARWLALIVWVGCLSFSALRCQAASILREVWLGIGGNAVADLTNNPNYPNKPSQTNFVTDFFEAPSEFADNYGQRMHGYIIPPVTGDYTFWLATDDGGDLYLSTDETPERRRRIAYVNGWTSSREWTRESNQQSAPIRLEAGKAYYIVALQKEGGGGDNLAVRWKRPDGVDQGPIPATYLYPFGTAFTAPKILEQPSNTAVVEGELARFTVKTDPLGVATPQWRRNGVNLPGANFLTLEYGPATMADNQSRFMAVLTNRLGTTNTMEAILTVNPDVTAPTLASALNLGVKTVVRIIFSEPVDPATAANPANYTFSNGVVVTGAVMGPDSQTVLLSTSELVYGASYTVAARNVRDRAATPNILPPGSALTFVAVEYAPADVGGATGGSTTAVDGGFNVVGGGVDLGGANDQFHFGYQERSGDFDIQVRLEDLAITDAWVQAGLLIRESLASNARFAGVFASSAELGCFFESRSSAGASSATAAPNGGFPVNYPEMHLRLRRVGSTFTGYAGFDGSNWQTLGSVSLALPSKILFGMGVASHSPTAVSMARFRSLKTVSVPGSFTHSPAVEKLGPSNRRTGLIFSEIMRRPAPRLDANNLEFVELYNAESVFVDLEGWRLEGAANYVFPAGTRIVPGQFLVVAADPGAMERVYGLSGALGPFSGRLSNGGESLLLKNRAGAVRLEVAPDANDPWPVSADGAGHSLVLARPSFGEDDPRAWAASAKVGGSPGQVDPITPNPWAGVVVNEFLAHTDDPVKDFIELHNASNRAVDLSGCVLTDNIATNKYRFPPGSSLPARGFLALDQDQLGFSLSAAGETIWLVGSDGSRVVDAVRFGGQENGVSSGRAPDGSPTIRRLATTTQGARNSAWKQEAVVVNEIMYHPISGDDDQYVELHNPSPEAVDLSGWSFVSGIRFEFPFGAAIPAGGHVVVGRDKARLLANYPQLNAQNTFGNFEGKLSGGGERVALAKPDQIRSTNAFEVVATNRIDILVSEVTYGDGGRWAELADGGGSSLELIDPRADTLRAQNWRASDETAKAEWTTVQVVAPMDLGAGGRVADRFFITMQGAGEALVDDVEVFRAGGGNLLANPGFETGVAGWSFFGNHSRSTVDLTGAFSGSRVLHVRSPGDGDTGPNSIRANLSSALAQGNMVTIRAKARWLSGWPEVLFRVRGNWVELPARLSVPKNLGTPGMANSRRVANAGPAIYDVAHTPALPRSNESVLVTARVSDPDGAVAPIVRFRVDNTATTGSLAMRDDGTGGDLMANDGIYSASLVGRPGGSLVAFQIEARDDAAASAVSKFPEEAPARECLVRWGDANPWGTFEHHHLWFTEATRQAFESGGGLNNTWRPATIVYGSSRVVYGANFRNKGSPYHGGYGDIAATVPKDDLLLGTDDRVYGSTGNGGSEGTQMKGDVANWVAEQMGIPFLHSHYIRLFINGGQFQDVLYDLEQPSRSMAKSWFGGGGVNDALYKIAVWFEFDDANGGFGATGASLERFLSNGILDLGRYRYNWQLRPDGDSANDYSGVFNLVNAINNATDRSTRLPLLADIEEWMRVFAFNRAMGNWDSYGMGYGQNMYLYTPLGQPANLMPWDVDFVLGEGSSPGEPLWGGSDAMINTLYDIPMFRRMLWRAYQDILEGPFLASQYQAQVDARQAALAKNGVNAADPSGIRNYVEARKDTISTQLQAADTRAFAITSNGGNDFTTANAVIQISGAAPFRVASIRVNGIPFPATWTGFTTWRLDVPLGAATNRLEIVGHDLRGNPIPGMGKTVTVRYSGGVPLPQDWVAINEIMYHAPASGGDYVEIFNRHPSYRFDLSGFRIGGLDYVLPAGTIIAPGGYLVLVEDPAAFAAAYGATIPVLGPYPGSLQNNGETLRLIKPGATPAEEVLVDLVRYENIPPWPANAAGLGSSLQLIDAAQDNNRAGNWGATAATDANRATPGRANATRATLEAFPLVSVNEVMPNNKAGVLDNVGEREPWIELHNAGPTAVNLGGMFLSDDGADLTRWQFPSGVSIQAGQFLVIWADGEPGESALGALHTGFRVNPTNGIVLLSRTQPGGAAAVDYLRYATSLPDMAYGSYPDGDPRNRRLLHTPTPGGRNDPTIPTLQLFVNEWMASNGSTLRDPADGHFEDWFELHNAGGTTADLSGFYLTDSQADPKKYALPPGTTIPPGGYRLFWADGEPSQNAPGRDIHVNFSLRAEGEEIALYTPDGQLVDLVVFGPQVVNVSQGRFPDGAEPPYVAFTLATPGGANISEFANQPPQMAAVADREVNEGERFEIQISATDPDPGQTLSYSIVAGPPGATVSPSGLFQWTPSEADGPGVFNVTLRAQDNGTPPRGANRSFRVLVAEINTAPTLSPLPPQVIDEGRPFSLLIPATDADLPGQALIYSLEGSVPEGVSIDPSGELRWTPTEAQGPGRYEFTVRVADSGEPSLSATQILIIQVLEVDNAPVIEPVGPQSVDELALFQIQVRAVDPDGVVSDLIYSIESAPQGVAIDPATGLLSWTPSESDGPRDYTIAIRVTEPGGLSSTVSFLLGVKEVNSPPTVARVNDVEASAGETVMIQLLANDVDLPRQTLSFSAEIPLPPGAALNTASGLFSWSIDSDPQTGTNRVAIRVLDDGPTPTPVVVAFNIIVRAPLLVAINEIMHRPAMANAEFVELANYSRNNTIDLGGWRLEGHAFEFPAGTILPPGGFLCVAKNQAAFQAAYGAGPAVLGNSAVSLPPQGGAIRLLRPLGPGLGAQLIDEVAFSTEAPWPSAAAQGSSLQLIDARQPRWRLGNWGASIGNRANAPVSLKPMTAQWRYLQRFPGDGWAGPSFADGTWPEGKALLYVETAALPEEKNTPLTLGQRAYYFRSRFQFDGNPEGATLDFATIIDDGAVFYLNGEELFRRGMPEGPIAPDTLANVVVGDAVLEAFPGIAAKGLRRGENVLAVEVHQTSDGSSDIVFGAAVDLRSLTPAGFTPGARNSLAAELPPFPPVWINEALPANISSLADNAGDRDPWIELFNAGALPVSLDGWWLSDNVGTLNKWAFPANTSIPAGGYLLVWADGEPAEAAPGHLHANFRLAASRGVVVLSRTQGSGLGIMDFLAYDALGQDQSFGSTDSAEPPTRGILATATPGSANQPTQPPAAPEITATLTSQGQLELSWPTQQGRAYRLERSAAVVGGGWSVIHQAVGNGSPARFLESLGGQSEARFYRVAVE